MDIEDLAEEFLVDTTPKKPRARKIKGGRRKIVDGVQKWFCCKCKEFLDGADFHNQKAPPGKQAMCKDCTSLYHKRRSDFFRRVVK